MAPKGRPVTLCPASHWRGDDRTNRCPLPGPRAAVPRVLTPRAVRAGEWVVRRKGGAFMARELGVLLMVLSPLVAGPPAMAQEKTIMPDLKALAGGKGGTIPADATLRWVEDAKWKPALKVQSKKDHTVIPLDRVEFTNGVIEFDALGQGGPSHSNFFGLAFRVADEKTYDAVYFRPFNFRAEEAERKARAVQYVSHPKYGWEVLRKDKPGRYEKPIVPAPDGDAWFHVR